MSEESFELASFWEHLDELRNTLVKVAWVIFIGMGTAFVFHQPLLNFLTKPINALNSSSNASLENYDVNMHRTMNAGRDFEIFELPKGSHLKYVSDGAKRIDENQVHLPPDSYVEWEQARPLQNLLILGPIEGLSISLKISFWVGLVGSSPLWLYFIFQFIAPALHRREKRLILPFLALSFLFIALGICFAYKITIPIANSYFFDFNENLGRNLWSFAHYLDYTMVLLLSNAIAFELFVIALLLVHYGFLKSQQMKNKRRHAIVAAFVLGAILTPPDVLSQVLMAIPLIILYELTILYALFREFSKKAHSFSV